MGCKQYRKNTSGLEANAKKEREDIDELARETIITETPKSIFYGTEARQGYAPSVHSCFSEVVAISRLLQV